MPGSLSNLRAYVNRVLVDKAGKTFHIVDEFIQHAHAAHLLAAVCDKLQIESPQDIFLMRIPRSGWTKL